MATFTLSGRRVAAHPRTGVATVGEFISVTWTDGKLSGDPGAVAAIEWMAAGYDGMAIRPPGGVGPTTRHRHLRSPYTARWLMLQAFAADPPPEVTAGAVPPLTAAPRSAIR